MPLSSFKCGTKRRVKGNSSNIKSFKCRSLYTKNTYTLHILNKGIAYKGRPYCYEAIPYREPRNKLNQINPTKKGQ